MHKSSSKQWLEFSVNKARKGGDACKQLEYVFHVAHLETARRILVDAKLQAGLVFDDSKLNKERILVNWLSPNIWVNGSRYGNVEFGFDFAKLIEDKRFYWVEVMRKYHPPACRILITYSNYSGTLQVYDPKVGDGPWWYDTSTDSHWWNGNYCIEFMVEENLLLKRCKGVSFVTHHETLCNLGGCSEMKLYKVYAASRFIARVLGEGLDAKALKLTKKENDEIVPTDELVRVFRTIVIYRVDEMKFHGHDKLNHAAKTALAKSILFYGALEDFPSEDALAEQFRNRDELIYAIADVFCKEFGITNKQPFLEE